MQFDDRVRNAQEQAQELDEIYEQLELRINAFTQMQQGLASLREQMTTLQAELHAVQDDVNRMQNTLPTMARKEEIEQLSRRIDAMPFEKLATRKDL